MQCIDCQTHVFPSEYAELLCRNESWVKTRLEGDTYVVTYGEGLQTFAIKPEVYSIERKLAAMDKAGVDVGVISINIPGPELLEPALGIEAAQLCNEQIAAMCRAQPDRLVGLAVIPWQDVEAALAELERAVTELDMRGVMLYSHLGGKPVDSAQFEPIYAWVEARGVPLVMHPTVPIWGEPLQEWSMIPMMGFMTDTSIAMLRLILSGVLERHPQLLVVHPHCGGVLPYLMPRVVEQTEIKGRGRENISKSPEEYYRQVYLDMVSPSTKAMQFAYDTSAPDRLVFGSDHPWVSIEQILACVEGMDIPAQHRRMLLVENACRLFGIPL